MNVWEIAILKSINSLGRNVTNEEVYDRISRFIDLTENDLKATRTLLPGPATATTAGLSATTTTVLGGRK